MSVCVWGEVFKEYFFLNKLLQNIYLHSLLSLQNSLYAAQEVLTLLRIMPDVAVINGAYCFILQLTEIR